MKLLAETFQRNLIVTDLKKWFVMNVRRFQVSKQVEVSQNKDSVVVQGNAL